MRSRYTLAALTDSIDFIRFTIEGLVWRNNARHHYFQYLQILYKRINNIILHVTTMLGIWTKSFNKNLVELNSES